MATDWAADVKKYAAKADDAVIAAIVRYCGIALRNRDSSLVSFSDPKELDRVRNNYLKKKLGRTEADDALNAAIAKVGEKMKADRTKNRVTVYYLLADHFKALGVFAPKAKAAAPAKDKAPAKKAEAKPAAKTAAKAAGVAAVAAGTAAAAKKPAAKKATPAKLADVPAKAAPAKKAAPAPAKKAAAAPAKKAAAAPAKKADAAPAKKAAAAPAKKAEAAPAKKAAAPAKKAAAPAKKSAAPAKAAAATAAAGGALGLASAAPAASAESASKAVEAAKAAATATGGAAKAAVAAAGDVAKDTAAVAVDAAKATADAGAAVVGAAGAAAAGAAGMAASAVSGGVQSLTGSGKDEDSGLGWLWWLLALAVLAFLAWYFFSRGPAENAQMAPTATTEAAAVGDASGSGVDLAVAPAEGTVTIPTGAGITSETRDGKPVVKVYFDSGKIDVVPDFPATAAGLKGWLETHPGSTLAISGYADPSGNAALNAELAKKRAQAVQAALVKAGIPETAAELVKPDNVTDATTAKDAARRVEVVVR